MTGTFTPIQTTRWTRYALVATLLVGVVLALGAGLGTGTTQADSPETTESLQSVSEGDTFIATSQGGFVAFSESSEESARESGVEFPSAEAGETPIRIQGVVNGDNTWEAAETQFPDLAVTDSLTAVVSAPNGLSGEILPEENRMTVEGLLNVSINGQQFEFEIQATSEDSNGLAGAADFGSEPASVTVVDNEFLVSDQTGGVIDRALGLPAETEGENWFELPLTVEFQDETPSDLGSSDDGNSGDGTDSTDDEESDTGDSSTETALTLFGQGIGFVGLLGAVVSSLFFGVARVRS